MCTFPIPDHAVQSDGVFFRHPIVQSMNLFVGCVCWVGLSTALFFSARRMEQARQSGKRWCGSRLPQNLVLC